MPDAVQELSTPPLRPLWSNAKKKAKTDSDKDDGESEKYKEMEKEFKSDLGPLLEKWAGLYPNLEKMGKQHRLINSTVAEYLEAIESSGLGTKISKPLKETLKNIKSDLAERMKKAEQLLMEDEELALQVATQASLTKEISPIVLYRQDVKAQVAAKAGAKAMKLLNLSSIPLEAILDDSDVIKHIPNDLDDGLLAEEMRDAANFDKVIEEIAAGVVAAAKAIRKKGIGGPEAQKIVNEALEDAVESALNRASAVVLKLAKIKTSYRKYKIKAGLQLTLTSLGAAAGVFGLAITPLTFGATTILGVMGVLKSGVALGQQISNLAQEAEGVVANLTKSLEKLHSQYEKASKTIVGISEVATTAVNAILPTAFDTIKSCKGDCDLLTNKIKGLVVKSHDQSKTLGKVLTEQEKLQKAVREIEQITKPVFTDAEARAVEKLVAAIDKTAEEVNRLIEKIGVLVQRVDEAAKNHVYLSGKLAALAAKEPKWAQYAEFVTNVVVGGAYIAGGAFSGPQYSFISKTVNDASEYLGIAISSLDEGKDAIMGVIDFIKEARKD